MKSKPVTPYEHLRREHQRLLDRLRNRKHVHLFFYGSDTVNGNDALKYIAQQVGTADRLGFDTTAVKSQDGSLSFVCIERVTS